MITSVLVLQHLCTTPRGEVRGAKPNTPHPVHSLFNPRTQREKDLEHVGFTTVVDIPHTSSTQYTIYYTIYLIV
jgi:hypothetical protein